MVADELVAKHKAKQGRARPGLYLWAEGQVDGHDVIFVKPLTYMNSSGLAVREILRKKNIPADRLIVVHDDIDMEAGRLKVKRGGAAGGHRGIESVIIETGSADFIRVKIGIGRDPFMEPEKYVLQRFKKDELPLVNEAVSMAASAVEVVITGGLQKAMNKFNKKAGDITSV